MASSVARVVRILAFGDSLTQGHTFNLTEFHPYTNRLAELLQSYKSITFDIDNAGITGEFARGEMSIRLPKILRENAPYDFVIILGGTNDLGESFTLDEDRVLFEEIRNLHQSAHRHGAKTMLLTIPESDYIFEDMGKNGTAYVTEEGEEGRIRINDMLRKFASETSDVTLCDLAVEHPHSTLGSQEKSRYWDDGLHYTPQGYDKMGEIVFEKMKHLFTD